MNVSKIYARLFFLLTFGLLSPTIIGQCNYQVTHVSGSQIVNNVIVTVNSSGSVGYYEVLCDDFSHAYLVGNNPEWLATDGSYTFQFSPPINGLSLDIVALDNWPGTASEEIQLFVNGNHYPVTTEGIPLECQGLPAAIVNPQGNIMADPVSHHGSWKGLNINGSIQTLTVTDHLLQAHPAGVFFALYICDGLLNQEHHDPIQPGRVYPNPFHTELTIDLPEIVNNATLTIINLQGQIVKKTEHINAQTIVINREHLNSGLYFLRVENNGQVFIDSKISIINK
jgi:hypothetical protein